VPEILRRGVLVLDLNVPVEPRLESDALDQRPVA
jgi:hypothetical protein